MAVIAIAAVRDADSEIAQNAAVRIYQKLVLSHCADGLVAVAAGPLVKGGMTRTLPS